MIKKIKFKGFKSFADNVEANLYEGMNAVIGPNGTGKSNIVDAISFVLGSKSAKKMRGNKLVDMIFAGNHRRSGKSEAMVSLILDNSGGVIPSNDNLEIEISRSIDRNGTSKFYINGDKVKQKDVHSLVSGTGIGPDGYSIIQQGEVKKILSKNDSERRSIFDEAAGITHLKKQNSETYERLKEINVDVDRLKDRVKTLEKSKNKLKHQSDKAEEYLSLFNGVKQIEVTERLNTLDDLDSSNKEISDEITKLKDENKIVFTDIESEKEEVQQSKQKLKNLNETFINNKTHLSNVEKTIEELVGSTNLYKEKINHAKQSIKRVDSELKEIGDSHTLDIEEYESLQKKKSNAEKELSLLEDSLREFEMSKGALNDEKEELIKKIEDSKDKSTQTLNDIHRAEITLDNIQKEHKDLKENILKLNLDLTDNKEKLSFKMDELRKWRNEKEAVHNNISEEKEELESKYDDLKKIKENYEHLTERSDNNNRKKFEAEYKISNLEKEIENNSFYGVKTLLSKRQDVVIGKFGDLIGVRDGYAAAIDALISFSMHYVIVESREDAIKCINYLKDAKAGRATLIPLSEYATSTKRTGQEKGIKASDLVIAKDERIRPYIEKLLKGVYVSDSVEEANNLVDENEVFKVATVSGDIVQKNKLQGGDFSKSQSGLLKKKETLNQLKIELDRLNKYEKDINQSSEKLKTTIDKIEEEIEKIEYTIESLYEDERRATDNINRLDNDVSSLSDQKELISLDLSDSKTYQEDLSSQDLKWVSKTKDLKSEQAQIDRTLSSKKSDLHDVEVQMSDLDKKIISSKEDAARLSEKIYSISAQLNKYDVGGETIESKIKKLSTEKEESSALISEFSAMLEEDQGKLSSLYDLKNKLQTIVNEDEENVLQQEGTIRDLESGLEKLQHIEKKISSDLHSKDLKKEKTESNRASIVDYLRQNYNIHPEEFDLQTRITLPKEYKKDLKEKQEKIKSLGKINHQSIDDYKEVEKTHRLEKEQYEDVLAAKEDLEELYENTKDEMEKKFIESFDLIADHFEKVFPELFRGGRGEVKLYDKKDILHSPIEIMATPPGKKKQPLDSLSGGEQSLVAISLIFAIISSNPSPFLVLDEVDAALDEANVLRFAKKVKEYSKGSQFIVITHRKNTMKESNFLLGITQKEKGVSFILDESEISFSEEMGGKQTGTA